MKLCIILKKNWLSKLTGIHKRENLNDKQIYENLLNFTSSHGNTNSNHSEEIENVHALINMEVSIKINAISTL